MMLFDGINERSFWTIVIACASLSATKWMLPLMVAWAAALPTSAIVHFWPVAAKMTSGPVMNMFAWSLTMTWKSVSAGE